jgi:hypothetical protein
VLDLDGENVIALKALADLSERLLKFEEAERRLQTLLALDRSNDEAREQLQRVETSRRQAEVASSAEPDSMLESAAAAEGVTAAAPESAGATDEAAAEPAPAEPAPALEPRAFEPPVAEPAVGWVSQSTEISDVPSPHIEDLEPSRVTDSYEESAGILFEEPTRYDPEVEPLEGLVGRDLDVPDATPGEFDFETAEDIVLGSEFQVPDASEELFAGNWRGERTPFEEDAPLPPPAAESPAVPAEPEPAAPEAAPLPEFVGWGGPTEEPVAELPVEPAVASAEAEPVVAMPEPEPAAEPAAMAAEPEPAPAQEPTAPPVAAPKRAYAASETGGRPVAHFLKDILASRPPAQAAPPAVRQAPAASGGGAPTRPAADALSLSSVFGEEEAPGTPPAVPAAGTGTGVSFDDFFGAPGATPTQRGTRAPDPKNDDLDQFHAWLQNLKR